MREEHSEFPDKLGSMMRILKAARLRVIFRREVEGDHRASRSRLKAFSLEVGTLRHSQVCRCASAGPEKRPTSAIHRPGAKDGDERRGRNVVPFFVLNLDATYEAGGWSNWPPLPAPLRWGPVNDAGSLEWSWWKLASCDGRGLRRSLYALGEKKQQEVSHGETKKLRSSPFL